MSTPGTRPRPPSQVFRPVYADGSAVPNARAVNIASRLDKKSGQHIILWKEIQRVFKDANHILWGDDVVSFMVDDNLEEIEPLRIEFCPNVELDVVVQNPSSLQSPAAIVDASQGSSTFGNSPGTPYELPLISFSHDAGAIATDAAFELTVATAELNVQDSSSTRNDPRPFIQQTATAGTAAPPLYMDATPSSTLSRHDSRSSPFLDITGSSDGDGNPFHSTTTGISAEELGVSFNDQAFIPVSLKRGSSDPGSFISDVSGLVHNVLGNPKAGSFSVTEDNFADLGADSIYSISNYIANPDSVDSDSNSATLLASFPPTSCSDLTRACAASGSMHDTLTDNGACAISLYSTVMRDADEKIENYELPSYELPNHKFPAPLHMTLSKSMTPTGTIDGPMPTTTPTTPTDNAYDTLIDGSSSETSADNTPPQSVVATEVHAISTNSGSNPGTSTSKTTSGGTTWTKSRNVTTESESLTEGKRRPGPHAIVEPIKLSLVPEDIQDHVLTYMEQLQTLRWHENPIPGLFIVLPTTFPCVSRDGSLSTSFRFFWMCEYGCDHPAGTDTFDHGSSTYMESIHYGFELDRPREFFSKYGAHLMMNLELFRYGRQSAFVKEEFSDPEWQNPVVDYEQGMEFLEIALRTSRRQVEQRLEWTVEYLLSWNPDPSEEGQMLYRQERGTQKRSHLSLEELRLLRTYLLVPVGMLGPHDHLYRTVDKNGYAHWVCPTHFYEFNPYCFPELIQRAVETCGTYSYIQSDGEVYGAYNGWLGAISVRPRTSAEALNLYSALVVGMGGVRDLILYFDWEVSVSVTDLEYLRDAAHCFELVSLRLRGPGFQTVSAPHAGLIADILTQPQIQYFQMEHAQGILGLIRTSQAQIPFLGLHTLQLSLDTTAMTLGVTDIFSGLIWLIENAPNTKSLMLDWPQLEEFFNVEVFLQSMTSIISRPIEVRLGIQGQEMSLTIEYNKFSSTKLMTRDISTACASPLIVHGHVEELTIEEPLDALVHAHNAMLEQIVSLNAGLRSLIVDGRAYDLLPLRRAAAQDSLI